MRRKTSVEAIVVWMACTAASVAGDADRDDSGDLSGPAWDVGAGSYVHDKRTTTATAPGEPERSMATEWKTTVVEVTDDARLVLTETRDPGETWRRVDQVKAPRKTLPLPEAKGTVQDLGTESLTIDGQSYACAKRRTTLEGWSKTTWTHEKLGLLRSESRVGKQTNTWAVSRLSTKATVAGKELECRETTRTERIEGDDVENDTITLFSDAVPGRRVRNEHVTRAKKSGQVVREVMEVVAFEKK